METDISSRRVQRIEERNISNISWYFALSFGQDNLRYISYIMSEAIFDKIVHHGEKIIYVLISLSVTYFFSF